MQQDFSNIKIQPLLLANNDVAQDWIDICILLSGVGKIDLPEDYLQFIKQFGEGAIGDHIYIFPIKKLCERTKFWRDGEPTTSEVKFFKKHNKNDCIVIGQTSADDVIFYLSTQYYFSTIQYEEKIYKLGSTITDIIEFFSFHKKYGKHSVRTFTPFDSSLSC